MHLKGSAKLKLSRKKISRKKLNSAKKSESITFEPKVWRSFNRFFVENKEKYHEIWIVTTNKKAANPQVVSFDEVISEAKSQGLIDSRIRNVDEKRYMIRLTKKSKHKRGQISEKCTKF